MKLKYLLIILVVLSSITMFSQEEEKKENPFKFKWDNGFKLENQDKSIKMKFGGRIMADHAYFFQDDELDTNVGVLETKSGTEFRRARLFMSGTIYSNVNFKLQIDFSGGKATLKDAYIGIKDIPVVGNIRVGHIKEPFRFDALTSSKYITFMERALPIDFSQERNNGILILNDFAKKRMSFQAGAFRNANNNSDDVMANDGYVLTGRLTGLVLNNSEKKQILHLGAAFSYRKPDSKEFKISSRPEAHLSGTKYISTGTIENVSSINLANFEGVLVMKSFSFQGEYLTATVNNLDSASLDSYSFSSYYGQISYFLTGENKNYKNSYAGFDRVKPNKNFGKEKGAGAWEVAVRVSNSDLNSEDVFGGEQLDLTVGLNWYLNPATRLMINYVRADIKDMGNASAIQGRLQIDF